MGLPMVAAPFLDPPVVTACPVGPATDRDARPGQPKPLLATAMAGLVPQALLARVSKDDFTRCVYAGIQANSAVLRELVDTSLLVDRGLVERDRARLAITRAVAGVPIPLPALHELVAGELWLRTQLAHRHRHKWTSAAHSPQGASA